MIHKLTLESTYESCNRKPASPCCLWIDLWITAMNKNSNLRKKRWLRNYWEVPLELLIFSFITLVGSRREVDLPNCNRKYPWKIIKPNTNRNAIFFAFFTFKIWIKFSALNSELEIIFDFSLHLWYWSNCKSHLEIGYDIRKISLLFSKICFVLITEPQIGSMIQGAQYDKNVAWIVF